MNWSSRRTPYPVAPFSHSAPGFAAHTVPAMRSEEHTSELQSLMRISYAVFCLKQKTASHMPSYHNKTKYEQTQAEPQRTSDTTQTYDQNRDGDTRHVRN